MMERKSRRRQTLLFFDKILFYCALALFAFTLLYALDYGISMAIMKSGRMMGLGAATVHMARRLTIYILFIVISFVLTALAFTYIILLRIAKKKNYMTLDHLLLAIALVLKVIDFLVLIRFRRALRMTINPGRSIGDIFFKGLGSLSILSYKPYFGFALGIIALIVLGAACVFLYMKIYMRKRPIDLSKQFDDLSKSVANAAISVKETAKNAADELKSTGNDEDEDYEDEDYENYEKPQRPARPQKPARPQNPARQDAAQRPRRPRPQNPENMDAEQRPRRPRPQRDAEYDEYNDYNKYNDNNQYNEYNDYNERPQRPQRPARPPRPARPDVPQKPPRPARPQNEDYDQGNDYDE